MFEWLEALIRDTPATYPIAAAAVALDAFFPVVAGVGELVRRLSQSGEDEQAAERDVDELLGGERQLSSSR